MENVLSEIRRRPATAGIRLVGIDGPSGSGKSTFARALAALAGAPVIEADDFVSWGDFSGWWPRFEEEVLGPLLRGRDAWYRVRDWSRDEFGASLRRERKLVQWAPLVIVEGVTTTRRAVSDRLAYRVWVEAPRAECLRRGLVRDGEDHRELWLHWQDEEASFFSEDDTRSRADLVVDTSEESTVDMERCKPMNNPLDDATLAAHLVHGLQPAKVTIVDYDPAWPERFERRAAELRGILGSRARLIEHIGSTSVPGLAAKPIVDIVVGIDDPDDEQAYLSDLEAAGYELRVREPGHRCLRIGEPGELVNLHCYPPGHVETRRYLAFRDRLRADDEDRDRYAAVKRELTKREWRDINYYAEAKRPVIFEILERAGWQE